MTPILACTSCGKGPKDNRDVLIFRQSRHWHPACYNVTYDTHRKAEQAAREETLAYGWTQAQRR